MKSVQVNGIRIAYRRFGAPQSPPVVLLHALGETSANWEEIAIALAVDHAVYALDLRGHGNTDRSERYRLTDMREDVIGFLTVLGLPPVTVIGHSMGGMVGYLVAQEWPDAISRLVLEDPPPPLPADPPRGMPERPEGQLDFDWAVVAALLPERNNPPEQWWEGLRKITARTLVLGGGPDSHIPQEGVAALAERIPHARLHTIPAGHSIHENDPGEFLAQVGPFLNG